jgi:hypothetical protein
VQMAAPRGAATKSGAYGVTSPIWTMGTLMDGFLLKVQEFTNLCLILVLPDEEGALGNGEFGGDAVERPTLGRQFNEPLTGVY